jgi:hypothetical protein
MRAPAKAPRWTDASSRVKKAAPLRPRHSNCKAIEIAFGTWDFTDEVERPRVLGRAESDVEVEPPRLGDLLAPKRPERAPVGASHELPAQVAADQCVFAVASARLPPAHTPASGWRPGHRGP